MLTACPIGFFGFGLAYGFMLLSNHTGYKKYILGLWVHESKCKIFIKVIVYILCAGVPAGIFLLISRYAAKAALLQYFLNTIGIELAGIGLSYLAPMLTQKLNIMELLPRYAENYLGEIEDKHEPPTVKSE